jgi:hypothetical protein
MSQEKKSHSEEGQALLPREVRTHSPERRKKGSVSKVNLKKTHDYLKKDERTGLRVFQLKNKGGAGYRKL